MNYAFHVKVFFKSQLNKGKFAFLRAHSYWLPTSFCFSSISITSQTVPISLKILCLFLLIHQSSCHIECFLNLSLIQLINTLHKLSGCVPRLPPSRFPGAEVFHFLNQATMRVRVTLKAFDPCEMAVWIFKEIHQPLFLTICCLGKFYVFLFFRVCRWVSYMMCSGLILCHPSCPLMPSSWLLTVSLRGPLSLLCLPSASTFTHIEREHWQFSFRDWLISGNMVFSGPILANDIIFNVSNNASSILYMNPNFCIYSSTEEHLAGCCSPPFINSVAADIDKPGPQRAAWDSFRHLPENDATYSSVLSFLGISMLICIGLY